jgi:hypothetical protein
MKNYNDRTIELLRRDMEAFDKQVRDCVVRLYEPMVTHGLDKLLTTHKEVVKLLEIVNEVNDTLDLVHDVCKVTHEHLCHTSLVYSYCDFAHGHDTRMEVVCELIGTILTDEVEMATREGYSPTFELLDCTTHLQVFVLD